MKLLLNCITDVGKKRSLNEDYGLVDDSIGLMLVADGMGGHGSGDRASQLTANAVQEYIQRFLTSTLDEPPERPESNLESDGDCTMQAIPNPIVEVVSMATKKANRVVFDENKAKGFSDGVGMGTTLAGVWRLGQLNEVVLFQVGDSRVYLYRKGELIMLTRDHTAYQEWERNGRVGIAPPTNLILRAIGLFKDVSADVRMQSIHAEDVLIVCSDGLTAMLNDNEIKEIVARTYSQPGVMGAALVKAANDAGGVDNITVVSGYFKT